MSVFENINPEPVRDALADLENEDLDWSDETIRDGVRADLESAIETLQEALGELDRKLEMTARDLDHPGDVAFLMDGLRDAKDTHIYLSTVRAALGQEFIDDLPDTVQDLGPNGHIEDETELAKYILRQFFDEDEVRSAYFDREGDELGEDDDVFAEYARTCL